MIEFPFIGGSYPEDDLTYSSQRTVNLYPEHDNQYKNQLVLAGFPGYKLAKPLNNGPVRGMHNFKEQYVIVVSGNAVFRLTPGGGVDQIGSINTSSGSVSMDSTETEVMLVDGQNGWIWDRSNLSIVSDTTFTATKADDVTSIDQFFLVNEPGTGRVWKSNALDGFTWGGSATATAEFKNDPVTAVWTDRELFLGGPHTVQVYYNSGASPMPYEPLRSGRMVYGIVSKDTVALSDNTTHFLARDVNGGLFVGKVEGYQLRRVSTRAWERHWASYPNPENSFAMSIQWRGHEWYVLTFNEADHGFGRTFALDASTGMWFEIGPYRSTIGDFEKWPINAHAYIGGRHFLGDVEGNIHEMVDDTYTFNGTPIISRRRAPVIHQNRERVFFNALEVDMYRGMATAETSDPKVMLDISDDGGHTWKGRRYKSMAGGASNKYDVRARFHQLGSAYDRVFQVSVSDPVKRKFLAGYVS